MSDTAGELSGAKKTLAYQMARAWISHKCLGLLRTPYTATQGVCRTPSEQSRGLHGAIPSHVPRRIRSGRPFCLTAQLQHSAQTMPRHMCIARLGRGCTGRLSYNVLVACLEQNPWVFSGLNAWGAIEFKLRDGPLSRSLSSCCRKPVVHERPIAAEEGRKICRVYRVVRRGCW